jgi:hypothetical protein
LPNRAQARGKLIRPPGRFQHPGQPRTCAEFAQDAQVLNRISGPSDSATRERIYQDPQNELVRARAAEARRNMRAFLTEADQKKAA